MTGIKPRYAAIIIPMLLVLVSLVAAVPHAATATKDLSATAPTSVHLFKNTTYIVRNDMAVMINGTVDMTVKYGSAVMMIRGVNNITLTAGDVINVSKDVMATIIPVKHMPTPLGATVATFEITPQHQVASVKLGSGGWYVAGRPINDPYARFLIVTEGSPPPQHWWKTQVHALLNTIVYGEFQKYFEVPSPGTVYVGISVGVGKWEVSIVNTGEPHHSSTGTGTDTLTPNTQAQTPMNAELHNKWLVPAVAGAAVIIIIIAVLLASAQHHHRR